MTIAYGCTKDGGFALLDTAERVATYFYPTSDLAVFAERAGGRKAAQACLGHLQADCDLVRRMEEIGSCSAARAHEQYYHILGVTVDPQILE